VPGVAPEAQAVGEHLGQHLDGEDGQDQPVGDVDHRAREGHDRARRLESQRERIQQDQGYDQALGELGLDHMGETRAQGRGELAHRIVGISADAVRRANVGQTQGRGNGLERGTSIRYRTFRMARCGAARVRDPENAAAGELEASSKVRR
jgi:hypothetical protein